MQNQDKQKVIETGTKVLKKPLVIFCDNYQLVYQQKQKICLLIQIKKKIHYCTSKVAARFPFTVFLEEGIEYYYCTCGLGAAQPFCDGQCEGTGFEPVKIIPKRSGNALLCGCKRQCDPKNPNCDGSHSVVNLDW